MTLATFLHHAMVCLSILAISCSTDPASPEPVELTALEKDLVQSDNDFGLKLFKAIAADETGANVFISPLSIAMALGMTLNGAAGETQQAMETTLALSGMSTEQINESYQRLIANLSDLDPKVTFEIANAIWYRKGYQFKPTFIADNQSYFRAKVSELDFGDPGALQTINQWVSNNTNDRIKKIIESIEPDNVMFLINAIFFKGSWASEFDADKTREDTFHPGENSSMAIDMMYQKSKFPYHEDDRYQAIDLPYGDGNYRMTVILPKPGVSIDSLVRNLDNQVWQQWTQNLTQQEIILMLPKFKLEYEKSLKDVLSTLGMGVAFLPGQADFSRMYEGPNQLFISKVKHKSFVQVDEEGTEAAAATSVGISLTSIPQETIMRVDRPFLFAIREDASGAILFIGKIHRPAFD
jgi:serpin B